MRTPALTGVARLAQQTQPAISVQSGLWDPLQVKLRGVNVMRLFFWGFWQYSPLKNSRMKRWILLP